MEKQLEIRWKDLTSFVPEPVRERWWSRITAAYAGRNFSGFAHLTRMFGAFDRHKDLLKDRYAFGFAIFFKNIVYNTLASSESNAEASAAMLREFSQETTLDQENHVADIIIKAGKGSTDVNLTEGAAGSDDLHYLLDFDLAFLGDEPAAFIQHEKAMRSEFPQISDQEYSATRLKTFICAAVMEKQLEIRWKDLTSFVPEPVRERWWSRITAAYAGRNFSGFAHLTRMFGAFDRHKDLLKDRYAFGFAIFFKNIVYNTLASSESNAEASAAMLREFSQETTLDQENHVADIIIKAGKGSTDVNLTEGAAGSDDLHYLLDFDLAFLGDEPAAFIQHEKAMRSEFPQISDQEYSATRLKTLRFFVQVPNIYGTLALRDEYESRARANIAKEIEMLEKGERVY